jgi:predicted metal-dependent phosphotriesterase family hydrolase
MPKINRRQFILGSVVAIETVNRGLQAFTEESHRSHIQTVLGPVPAEQFGPALVHEHVMCDFIGAGETGPHRWDVDEVVRTMLPYMKQLKDRGFKGFVDCTPAYIGRDPRVLLRLAKETGLHIVTNTGYYGGAGDKYVPEHAYQESVSQLADRWIREWDNGIENTGIKPGFIKIGVDEASGNPAALSDIDAKLVKAAAMASKRTGLTTVCHTGGGSAGLAATRLFIQEGGLPSRFIVAHSDGHGLAINKQIADLGAWVSFDAISRMPIQDHLKMISAMQDKYSDRILLSHDNGWYWVGQKDGGEIRDFNYLSDTFLPALRKNGTGEEVIRKLTSENPGRAFGVPSQR